MKTILNIFVYNALTTALSILTTIDVSMGVQMIQFLKTRNVLVILLVHLIYLMYISNNALLLALQINLMYQEKICVLVIVQVPL